MLWHFYISPEVISIDCNTVISLLKLSQLTLTQLYLYWSYLNCCDTVIFLLKFCQLHWHSYISPEVISIECDTVISLMKLSLLTVTQLYLSWSYLNWVWHSYISHEVISIDCDTVISLLKLSQLTLTQLYLYWSYLNCSDTVLFLLKFSHLLWHFYISPEVISIDCNTVISLLKLSQLTLTQLYLYWSYLNCSDTVLFLLKLSQLLWHS